MHDVGGPGDLQQALDNLNPQTQVSYFRHLMVYTGTSIETAADP
jgi:hypothetical protein